MFVKWKMTPNPYTVSPEDTVPHAVELMQEKVIRKLPVVQDGKVVGLISQSDINRASPSMATSFSAGEITYLLSKLKIKKIMTKNPLTIGPDALLEEAAVLMRNNRVEMLPVVENEQLVGVITESDLIDAFIELNGARNDDTRLVIETVDGIGVMEKLSSIFADNAVSITHIAVYRSGPEQIDRPLVVIGVNTTETAALEEDIAKAGFTLKYKLQRS